MVSRGTRRHTEHVLADPPGADQWSIGAGMAVLVETLVTFVLVFVVVAVATDERVHSSRPKHHGRHRRTTVKPASLWFSMTIGERPVSGRGATMSRRSAQPRRHRMRKQARRESARAWAASGAAVSVKAFARRYGVDRYTAYEDLIAIGFAFPSGDTRWAVRPTPTPNPPRTEPVDLGGHWIWTGDHRMFVVGYTPGGAPYGWIDDSPDDADDWLP